MVSSDLSPVPLKSSVTDDTGLINPSWGDWFQRIFLKVGPDGWRKSTSASGYQKLPSGLVIQWGVTASLTSGSTNSVSFPIAFPTACLQVITGIRDNSATSTATTGQSGSGNYSESAFDLYNRTSVAQVFNWFAVGY